MTLRMFWLAAAGLAAATAIAQPVQAQSDDVHRSFAEVGFAPQSTLRERGQESFRIWLHDPYLMLGVPAVEAVRDGDRIKVVAAYATFDRHYKLLWTQAFAPLTNAQWETLKSAEARIRFDPPPDRGGRSDSGIICHGWWVSIETGPTRAGSWWGCTGKLDDPVFVFADLVAKELVASNPGCVTPGKFSGEFENFWEFSTCFGARPQLDDPELEAKRAGLARKWAAIYNGDSLLAARTLMRRIEREKAPIGGPLWRDARRAAELVRVKNEELRNLSIEAYRVSASKETLSDADRVKLESWVKEWDELVDAQDNNYRELLQNLVDARLP